jgi:imidazoleglycerol phosphate synthase glutamine amidotransferase subunit HisH
MTKEQIEILRCLIKGEIEAAIQNENGYKFSFEQEKSNDQGWETFIDSFTSMTTT